MFLPNSEFVGGDPHISSQFLVCGLGTSSFSPIPHYLSVSGGQWISSRQWLKPAKSPFKPLDGRRGECTDQPRSLEQKIVAEGHCGM